jgi:hypothetical protein
MHDPFSFIYEPKKKEKEVFEQIYVELYDFPLQEDLDNEKPEEESVFIIQL